MTAYLDNSDGNPNNPNDPAKSVTLNGLLCELLMTQANGLKAAGEKR